MFISLPFFSIGAASRNDPDDFNRLTVFVAVHYRVRDDKDGDIPHLPVGLPSLFTIFDAIQYRDVERITKHQTGILETDAMFAKIGLALGHIPFEAGA
ncbi:hypothetical protein FHW16_005899 [Phyllobacterium myrsinacearum]|uniref:Uncharacterized protein n=1 Tax=Phyllobacterium myrsinacearum TaxID=28101 RepID=A0A839F0D9_9HYPH|nr:hypothetical protein [Phyllobacterium myrsinacearum]